MTRTMDGRIQKIGLGAAEFDILERAAAASAPAFAPVPSLQLRRGKLDRDTLTLWIGRTRILYTGSPRDISALVRATSPHVVTSEVCSACGSSYRLGHSCSCERSN